MTISTEVSISSWARKLMIGAISFLFIWQASAWAYNNTMFATKAELVKQASVLKERTSDLKEYVKERFDMLEKSLKKD